jgi:hypothetical protein
MLPRALTQVAPLQAINYAIFYEIETRDRCYKTNTTVIYCHFRLNYHTNSYNIEFTLE